MVAAESVPNMRDCEGHQYRIGAVERALEIIDAVAEGGEVSLSRLATDLDMAKGTLFRHLRVLESAGYLTVDAESKRYALGPALIHLGYAALRGVRIRDIAMPGMRWLRERHDETVHLGILNSGGVVHIAVMPSGQRLTMAAPVGDRALAHASALGKAILGWATEEVVSDVLTERGLPGLTERTITDPADLKREIARVRRRGFAMDNEEAGAGLRCIAAPVRDATSTVVAAISVSGPVSRISRKRTEVLAPSVVMVADYVSAQLGWPGNGRLSHSS